MRSQVACLLLTGTTTLASAQTVSGRVFASHDSVRFSERIASLGWTGAHGLGLRVDGLAYRAPGWDGDGAQLAATYQRNTERQQVDLSLGRARVAGFDHTLGRADVMQQVSDSTALGLSVERNVVSSARALQAGLVFNSLALVADHAAGRFSVGAVAGQMRFADGNERSFVRTRWNWMLHEPLALNAYVKTRSWRDSDPNGGKYFSPERLNEVSGGVSLRVRVSDGVVLAAQADLGEQHADSFTKPIWSSALALSSPRHQRVRWAVALQASNAASTSAAPGSSYRYTSLTASINVPF
jgi:hypothetical protein